MYVADVTDIEELEYLLSEAKCQLAASWCERGEEQAVWDIEDILQRIEEVRNV